MGRYAPARSHLATEKRIELLEEQVEVLRRTIGLLTASAKPAVEWMDAEIHSSVKGAEEG